MRHTSNTQNTNKYRHKSFIFHGTASLTRTRKIKSLILNTFNHRKWKTQINNFGIYSVVSWSPHWLLICSFLYDLWDKHSQFSIINIEVCQKHFALINLKIFYHFIKSNCMLLGRFQALSDLVGSWLLVTETNGKIRIEIHYF